MTAGFYLILLFAQYDVSFVILNERSEWRIQERRGKNGYIAFLCMTLVVLFRYWTAPQSKKSLLLIFSTNIRMLRIHLFAVILWILFGIALEKYIFKKSRRSCAPSFPFPIPEVSHVCRKMNWIKKYDTGGVKRGTAPQSWIRVLDLFYKH